MSAPRPRADRLLPLLRPRHWPVLKLLAAEPLLATSHVEALVFNTGTPLSRARTCRRALRELTEWGLLHRERRPAGRHGGGSDPATYALTARGDRLLALRDGRSLSRYRRPADRGQASRAHLLALADLHVAVAKGARARGAELTWQSEPACWRDVDTTSGPLRLKPDAYLEIDLPSETRLAWLELDRGTQSLPVTIHAKVLRYLQAARAIAAQSQAVPAVVFVTTQPQRRERLTALLLHWAAAEGLSDRAATALFTTTSPEAAVEYLV